MIVERTLVIFFLVVAAISPYFMFAILKRTHPRLWEELGRPGFPHLGRAATSYLASFRPLDTESRWIVIFWACWLGGFLIGAALLIRMALVWS